MEQNNISPSPSPKNGVGKIVAWIVIVIIVILAIWYFTSHKTGDTMSQTKSANQTATSQNMQPTPASEQSLKDLMMLGASQKCTVSFSNNNSQSQGTIYLSGGKMRGDFTAQVQGKAMVSHMINDGTTTYTWVDGMATGFKMQNQAAKASATPTGTMDNQHQSVDPNAKYNYNCSAWSADGSMFVQPSGINFSDMSSMMMNGSSTGSAGASAGGSANSNASMCAACANAGTGKAQCLAALHCPQ